MASHLQLLGMGIVDQLANLEGSLISMFLESSLRLAHVINADFFILVETPSGGRRVAGSDKLCREFSEGTLTGSYADVRARLKDEKVAILEEPLASGDIETAAGLPRGDSDVEPGIKDGSSPDSLVGTSSNSAFQRPSIVAEEDNFPTGGLNQVNPFTASSSNVPSQENSFTPNANALRTICQRRFDSSSSLAAGVKRPHESSNGVSGAKRMRSDEFDAVLMEPGGSMVKFESWDDDVEVIPTQNNGEYDRFASSYYPNHLPSNLGYPPADDGENEFDFTDVRNYLNESGKVACIVNRLANGQMDLTKQSNDMRLFGSIMYDLGKMLSRQVKIPDKCHPETKRHFTQAYDVVWAGITGIDAFARSQGASSLGDHFRGLSLKAFLRCQFYSAFKNALARTLRKLSAT